MARLVLKTYKTKLPQGLMFALRARDLERAFERSLEQDLYMELFHEAVRDYLRRTRAKTADPERVLLLAFHPEPPAAMPDAAWQKISGARVVFCNAYAFAKTKLRALGSRAVLADAMVKAIRGYLTGNGLENRWSLEICMDWTARELQCQGTTWIGLREESPSTWSVRI